MGIVAMIAAYIYVYMSDAFGKHRHVCARARLLLQHLRSDTASLRVLMACQLAPGLTPTLASSITLVPFISQIEA
jgi:hypothetical protein